MFDRGYPGYTGSPHFEEAWPLSLQIRRYGSLYLALAGIMHPRMGGEANGQPWLPPVPAKTPALLAGEDLTSARGQVDLS